MNIPISPPRPYAIPPDHKSLPDSDGAVVENLQQLPQALVLTDSILPVLRRLHPDEQFVVGGDSGIYWRLTDPPLNGCKAPDWYYVPDRPPLLDGELRRSYVLWVEGTAPQIVIEFASGDGSEERDRTPGSGKFWVYERGIRVPYYAIFDGFREALEVFHLVDGTYQPLPVNERGHYPIRPMGVELGLWRGTVMAMNTIWLRWFDAEGNLLPSNEEQNRAERQAREDAQRRADETKEKAARLAEKLRALGINPDEV